MFVFVSSKAYLKLRASSLIPLWCAHSETDNARPRPGVRCPYKAWPVFSLFVFVYIVNCICVLFTIPLLYWHRSLHQCIVSLGCFSPSGLVEQFYHRYFYLYERPLHYKVLLVLHFVLLKGSQSQKFKTNVKVITILTSQFKGGGNQRGSQSQMCGLWFCFVCDLFVF